jgi:SAM-dependent methyltransferase
MNIKKTLDTYFSLCTEYYDIDKPEAPVDALQFYLDYAKQSKGPILEPMCGTGRFFIPMLELGLPIEGFDASNFMLNRLHEKCNAKNINPNVWHRLIEDMDQQDKYDLIFIPNGSFGLIIDKPQVNMCLLKIYNALHSGGTLVFEAETLYAIPEQIGIWKGSVSTREDEKKILLSTLDLPLEDNVSTTLCRYDLIDGKNIIKTEIENFRVRLYDPLKLCSILEKAGFKNIKMIKPFDRNKEPDNHCELVIYECSK